MKKRLLQLLVFALVLALPLMALADFGDFSGDSDFGGSWDSGSSWDSDWDSDWDDDWSSSSWDDDDDSTPLYVGSFGGGSGGDDDGFPIWIIVGIIIVIVIVVNSKKGSKSQARRPVAPGAVPTAESTLKPMSEYMVFDAMFNETDLIEKLSNRYVQMQNCWQNKDISSLRPYFTDNLFNQMNRGV